MTFAHPWFLLLLPAVFVLIWWEKKKRPAAIAYSDLSYFRMVGENGRFFRHLHLGLNALGLVLIILALARPQRGRIYEEVETSGIDIMLCLDVSQTMSMPDYSPMNRLHVAKERAKDFVRQRPGDRIGMVIFAQTALTQCPLTLDHKIVTELIDRIRFNIVPWQQTAIGTGLAMSLARLKETQTKERIVILLTDGQNNAGDIDPLTAARLAQTYGVKVYCIGVGTKGRPDMPEQAELDMNTLNQIAELTGGRAFLATDAEGLKLIYEEINRMEPTTFKVQRHTVYSERAGMFLTPAGIILLLNILLGLTFMRRLP